MNNVRTKTRSARPVKRLPRSLAKRSPRSITKRPNYVIIDEPDSFVVQARLMRLLQMISCLLKAHRSIKELAQRFDVCERTVYRYILILEQIGYSVDTDKELKRFIVDTSCPVCGKEVHHG
jgi:biotin operon repressor